MHHIYRHGETAPAPNMCMFCESRPMPDTDEGLIDTGLNFMREVGVQTALHGRKMICTPCAKVYGLDAGLMDPEYVRLLQAERDELAATSEEIRRKLEALESGHIEAFQQLIDRHVSQQGLEAAAAADRPSRVREARS